MMVQQNQLHQSPQFNQQLTRQSQSVSNYNYQPPMQNQTSMFQGVGQQRHNAQVVMSPLHQRPQLQPLHQNELNLLNESQYHLNDSQIGGDQLMQDQTNQSFNHNQNVGHYINQQPGQPVQVQFGVGNNPASESFDEELDAGVDSASKYPRQSYYVAKEKLFNREW